VEIRGSNPLGGTPAAFFEERTGGWNLLGCIQDAWDQVGPPDGSLSDYEGKLALYVSRRLQLERGVDVFE
jgi:hypothetical protein